MPAVRLLLAWCLLISALGLVASISACAGIIGGGTVIRTVVTDATVTPSPVHVGDVVLVDYSLEQRQVHYGSGSYDQSVHSPRHTVSAGEALPLAAAVYTPGGALPEFEAAREALDQRIEGLAWDQDEKAIRGGHAYYIFRAPETAQMVTLDYFAGSADGFSPKSSRRTLKVEVLP
jgi:hypothetical protein